MKYLPEIEWDLWTTQDQGTLPPHPEDFDAVIFTDWWLARYIPAGFEDRYLARSVGRVTSHHLDLLRREHEEALRWLPRFKAVGASSARLQEIVPAYTGQPCLRLRAPVDLDLFSPKMSPKAQGEGTDLHVGWCGRIPTWQDWKGYGAVYSQVRARAGVRICLHELTSSYRSQDFVQDMPGWYRNLDVLLSTSFFEGDPLPVLEALACGVPVVATDAGIVPEVVVDDCTGWVVSGASNEERVSGCLDRLMWMQEHPQERFEMGITAAAAIARLWSPSVIRCEVLEALEQCR